MKLRHFCTFIILIGCCCYQADAWWRRRRRRCPPADTDAPVFTTPCSPDVGRKDYGEQKTVTRVPIFWPTPHAHDIRGHTKTAPVHISSRNPVPPTFGQGSYVIEYEARDSSPRQNTARCTISFSVKVVKCSALPHPADGYHSCSTNFPVNVGTTCFYTCHQWYRLVGNSQRTCNQVGTSTAVAWSGSDPSCQEITCPPLSDPQHGTFTCTDEFKCGSTCSFLCNDGYSLTPGQVQHTVCTLQGSWSTPQVLSCTDTASPVFDNCPQSRETIYALATETTAIINWTKPTVRDNSGEDLQIMTDAPEPGSRFPEGMHTFTYTATDSTDNVGMCSFTRTVKVIRCSVPVKPFLIFDCTHESLRGSTCSFSCSTGYRVDGARNTTCILEGNVGKWKNEFPTCTELHCPNISAPANGLIRSCPTTDRSSCYFECFAGYWINNNVLRCVTQPGTETAFWEGELPVCEVETCDRPVLSGGLEVADNTTCAATSLVPAGDNCAFGCTEGYSLAGRPVAFCGLDGLWNQTLPMCQAITCPANDLPSPSNGGKSGCSVVGDVAYGTVCTFFCDRGYQPSEPPPVNRTCEADENGIGVWSGETISCQIIQCQPLLAPPHGYVHSCRDSDDVTQLQDYNTQCQVLCNEGYTPLHPVSRTCLAESMWDGIDQQCVDQMDPVLDCPPDQDIFAGLGQLNAIVTWDDWEPVLATDAGMTLTAQLESIDSMAVSGGQPSTLPEGDYVLVYSASDAAGNKDSCSFNVAVKVSRCLALYPPANGNISLVSGQGSCQGGAVYGSQCEASCDEGYELSGDDLETFVVTCNRNSNTTTLGFWSDPLPTCNNVECVIPSITNGRVLQCPLSSANFGDECRFQCDDGFMSSSGEMSVTRACQSDATFSGQDLNCDVPITCPAALSVTHGTVTPTNCTQPGVMPYDATCTFSCNDGFIRENGPSQVVCTSSGTWDEPPNVICRDVRAPSFDVDCPVTLTAEAERGTTQAVVEVTIPTAMDNSDNVSVQLLGRAQNQTNMFSEGTTVQTYTAIDPTGNTATCDIYISVEVFRCPRLSPPSRGSVVNCSDPIYGSQCSFRCNVGHELSGPSTRSCELTEGQGREAYWNGSQPTCQPITCPALAAPGNAVKFGCTQDPPGTEVYGTECLFDCPYGYVGVGDNLTTCQADGTWTRFNFSCQATRCPALSSASGVLGTGILAMPSDCTSSPRFGETCFLSCNRSGYEIFPQASRQVTCQGNGQWTQEELSTVACNDTEKPVFTSCPQDFTVYPPRGEVQVNVTWNVTATDNSREDPTVTCDKNMGPFSEGEYDVECVAVDSNGNVQSCPFKFEVEVRRCPQLQLPAFGAFVGTCNTIWGSECRVTCSEGYRLVGSSSATCEFDGNRVYWDKEEEPMCEVVQCDPLELPPNVSVNPPFCASQNVNRGTTCTPGCAVGRTLEGDSSPIMCENDGQWSRFVNTTSDIACPDRTAPRLTSCPAPISVTRTEVWGVEVTFTIPTATDSFDQSLDVIVSPENLTNPYNFTEDTTCSYTFVDDANNSITCEFVVYVRDETPPRLIFCPNDFGMNSSARFTTVTWPKPQFDQVGGGEPLITSNYESEMASLIVGRHNVNYLATHSDNGKTTVCTFTISIVPVPCQSLEAPANGALACDLFAFGTFCSMFCNENHDIPKVFPSVPERYVCGLSGLWDPHAFVPDCSEGQRGRRARLPTEVLYYSGTCGTDETNQQIAEAFLQLFRGDALSNDYCTEMNECSFEDVQVTCGPITSRRRKRSVEIGRSARTQQDEKVLNNRQRRASNDFVFALEFNLVANVDLDAAGSDYDATVEVETELMAVLDGLVDDGNLELNITVEGFTLTFDNTSLSTDLIELACDPGYVADNDVYRCLPCVAGTHFQNTTQECVQCEKGTYENETGQVSCKQCPDGQSTADVGAKNMTQCADTCKPGTSSSTSVVPCYMCDIGTFQPDSASTECLSCPNGTTTRYRGSNSSDQCLEPCQPGSSSPSGFAPCTPCPSGSYQPVSQQTGCITCPGTTTTQEEGVAEGTLCLEIDECESNPCRNNGTCLDQTGGYQCTCLSGFTGDNCDLDVDECDSGPCLNGATCTDGIDNFQCTCTSGYSGTICDEDIDECLTSPCVGNATCMNHDGDYQCLCLTGYSGKNCDISPCSTDPCQNGATCAESQLTARGYECQCVPGYRGVNCSSEIDECRNGPCMNGGQCMDGINSFTCSCSPGYAGDICEIDIDLCENVTCQNNGTCSEQGDGTVCVCQAEFSGEFCENVKTGCDDSPCVNGGSCLTDAENILAYSCICPEGFIGQNCEINVDDCRLNPCSNGGLCVDGIANYTCECAEGFEGSTCDNEIDGCSDHPCGPNSTCINNPPSFHCLCAPGFTGGDCRQLISICEEEAPCRNGATCTDESLSFRCSCAPGYQGYACENEINECLVAPCQNGGTCHDMIAMYQCTCLPGYNGTNCEINIDDCASSPCIHGSCEDGIDMHTCSCDTGFTGPDCDQAIDYCSNNPCENGMCSSLMTGYDCTCFPGYRGRHCETDIDECLSFPCFNAIDCEDRINGYTCTCEPGFSGSQCEVDINECALSPCANNATCINQQGRFSCDCLAGFEGDICEINTDDCQNHRCVNGGTCIDDINSYTCQCPDTTYGALCQLRVLSDCATNPCRNGGTCNPDSSGGFTCDCVAGFTGTVCDTDIVDCPGSCASGSTCIDQVNGYRCVCPFGVTGQYCDRDIDDCTPDSCLNGGSCVDGRSEVTCLCLPGYTGLRCETDIIECAVNPCANGGTCQDGVNEFLCLCAPGYSGPRCLTRITRCDSNPCFNGSTCVDEALQFVCICAPGYSGPTCDTALPSNYDLTLDHLAPSVNSSVEGLEGVENLVVSVWIQTSLTSSDLGLFTFVGTDYVGNNVQIGIRNPCDLTLFIAEDEFPSGNPSLCDQQWHHVTLLMSFTKVLPWVVLVDGALAVSGERSDRIVDGLTGDMLVTIGAENLTQGDELKISNFNVWSHALDENLLTSIQTQCQPGVFGDVISWTDLVSEGDSNLAFGAPSQCDDTDDCLGLSPPPCQNGGTCMDKLNGFECSCPPSYAGTDCEITINLCDGNRCQNGGSCNDNSGVVSCTCAAGFTGEFCELVIVDGGWTEWMPWTQCSASCEGGTRHRTRECINPAPNDYGQPCAGLDRNEEECNTDKCPACSRLIRPRRGLLSCMEEGDSINCTISCLAGYALEEFTDTFYTCGPHTYHRWGHQTDSNPRGRLPSCMEVSQSNGVQMTLNVPYQNAQCRSQADQNVLLNSFTSSLNRNVGTLGCVHRRRCQISSVKVNNCATSSGIGRRKRAGEDPVYFSIVATQNSSAAAGQAANNGPQQPLEEFADGLMTLAGNGSLSLVINDQVIDTSPDLITGDVIDLCPFGEVEVGDGSCVPCLAGMYKDFVVNTSSPACVACPLDTYQDQDRQEECIPCPEGLITLNFYSDNLTDCIEPPIPTGFTTIVSSEIPESNTSMVNASQSPEPTTVSPVTMATNEIPIIIIIPSVIGGLLVISLAIIIKVHLSKKTQLKRSGRVTPIHLQVDQVDESHRSRAPHRAYETYRSSPTHIP